MKSSNRSFIRVQQQQQANENQTNQLKRSVRSKLPMHDQNFFGNGNETFLPDICSCDNATVNTGLNQHIPVRVTSRSPHCTIPRYYFMDNNKRSRNLFNLINIKPASPANTKL